MKGPQCHARCKLNMVLTKFIITSNIWHDYVEAVRKLKNFCFKKFFCAKNFFFRFFFCNYILLVSIYFNLILSFLIPHSMSLCWPCRLNFSIYPFIRTQKENTIKIVINVLDVPIIFKTFWFKTGLSDQIKNF